MKKLLFLFISFVVFSLHGQEANNNVVKEEYKIGAGLTTSLCFKKYNKFESNIIELEQQPGAGICVSFLANLASENKHFRFQPSLGINIIRQHIVFSSYDSGHFGDYKWGDYIVYSGDIFVTLLPLFSVWSNRIHFGLGCFGSINAFSSYYGEYHKTFSHLVYDSLSPTGYILTTGRKDYYNSEISFLNPGNYNYGIMFCFGYDFKIREKKYGLDLRIYRSRKEFFNLSNMRFYYLSLAINIPINKKSDTI